MEPEKPFIYANADHLDRAISNYKKQLDDYYKELNEAENAPPDVRKQRLQKVKEGKRYLDLERNRLNILGDVFAGLAEYQQFGRSAAGSRTGRKDLEREEHHPTDVLENYMLAAGKPKPSPSHTAHHIVPGKGKTKWANRARVRMHLFGVRINDPDNGVYLPTYKKDTPSWAMPKSLGHLEYHTHGYEIWVNDQLQKRTGEPFIRQELRLIGKRLQQNNLPPEARKKG